MTGPFLLSISVFLFLVFFISLFCCGSVRQIKLAIFMLAFGRTLIYVVEVEVEVLALSASHLPYR